MRILCYLRQQRQSVFRHQSWLKSCILDLVFSVDQFLLKLESHDYDLVLLQHVKTIDVSLVQKIHVQVADTPIMLFANSLQLTGLSLLKTRCQPAFHPDMHLGKLSFCSQTKKTVIDQRVMELPLREALLLEQLLLHHQHFLSKEKIARLVLRDVNSYSSNLPEVYIYRLRRFLRLSQSELRIRRHRFLGYQITHCQSQ